MNLGQTDGRQNRICVRDTDKQPNKDVNPKKRTDKDTKNIDINTKKMDKQRNRQTKI